MLRLDPIFTSHGVFAAQKPIRVYGTGDGTGEISFAGQTRKAEASEGKWLVEFPPMEYGGPYTLTARFDGTETQLEDLYIGEVYLMGGQSNMQFKLRESTYPADRVTGDPMVRLFTAPRPEEEPYTPADGWVVSTTENAPDWSAIAYHVGMMRAEKGIAIGLIACYQGASVIESWLPEGTAASLGIFIPEEHRNCNRLTTKYNFNGDGMLYHFALETLFPYSLTAVVWYQGESNRGPEESVYYKPLLTEFIAHCRKEFRDEALPWVEIQIADFDQDTRIGWKNIQKAQYEIQFEVPGVKTVICADVCESNDIHPVTKIHLARRAVDALAQLCEE